MHGLSGAKRHTVLLVEDNDADAELVAETLATGRDAPQLQRMSTGQEVIDFFGAGHQTTGLPSLILLDLNLPRKNGREVLSFIRAKSELKLVPVVVFTSSEAEDDIRSCYALGANCYLSKPGRLDDYQRVVRLVREFWLDAARVPALTQAPRSA